MSNHKIKNHRKPQAPPPVRKVYEPKQEEDFAPSHKPEQPEQQKRQSHTPGAGTTFADVLSALARWLFASLPKFLLRILIFIAINFIFNVVIKFLFFFLKTLFFTLIK